MLMDLFEKIGKAIWRYILFPSVCIIGGILGLVVMAFLFLLFMALFLIGSIVIGISMIFLGTGLATAIWPPLNRVVSKFTEVLETAVETAATKVKKEQTDKDEIPDSKAI